MVCAGLETLSNPGILDILKFPTTCFYYFYFVIMIALYGVLTSLIYQAEKLKKTYPNFISCAAISSFVILWISLIGTLLTIIESEIMILLLLILGIPIVVWFLKK